VTVQQRGRHLAEKGSIPVTFGCQCLPVDLKPFVAAFSGRRCADGWQAWVRHIGARCLAAGVAQWHGDEFFDSSTSIGLPRSACQNGPPFPPPSRSPGRKRSIAS
jgi:hypothetical protein